MIDTKVLRDKIIDLAVQGKLTQQLVEDGDAQSYIKQILEKKGKFSETSIEKVPFKIPNNWKWVRLSDICTKIVDGDHNPPVGARYKTDYYMISAKNINDDKLVNLDSVRYLEEKVFEEKNKRTQLKSGDVLLTIVATLGRSCVYREDMNICFQRSVCVISTLIYPEYLKRYLDCTFIQKFIRENATGAAQPGFYLNKVEKLYVPVPPPNEQEEIVKKITEVFELLDMIDDLQKLYLTDIESLKSKLIDAGIRGKLTEQLPDDGTAEELYAEIQEEKARLIKEKKIKKEKALADISEDEIPFEIPSNWKWVRLIDISNKIWAGGDKPDDFIKVATNDRNIPVVANGVINDGILGYTSMAKAQANTITVAGRGTIGFCTYRDYEYCPIVRLIVIEPSRGVYPKYLKVVLQALEESSLGSSIPQLTVPMIKPKLIPLPPYAEQARISDKLESILNLI